MDGSTSLPSPSPSSLPTSISLPGHEPAVIAPAIFGYLLQFGLFCVLCTQAAVYFARQGYALEDSRLFCLYVAVVFVATTLQVSVGVWRLYTMCVVLTPWYLQPWSWCEPVSNSVVISAVHVFFVHRCYKLSRSRLILGVLSTLFLAQSISWIIMIVNAFQPSHIDEMRSTTLAVFSIAVLLDSLTSVTLFYNLWRQRTGHGQVDAVVLRVLRMTVESIFPCLVFTVVLIIGTAYIGTIPLGALFILALPSLAPLYANALFTTLNARARFRRRLDGARQRSGGRISLHIDDSGIKTNRASQLNVTRANNTTPAQDGNALLGVTGSELIDTRSHVAWDTPGQPPLPPEDELKETNRSEARQAPLLDPA